MTRLRSSSTDVRIEARRLTLGATANTSSLIHLLEPLEARNAPSDSLGLLFAFPLSELLGDAAEIGTRHWQNPVVTAVPAEATHQRFISAPNTARFFNTPAARGADIAVANSEPEPEPTDRSELPPPANILDRIFAGLAFDPLAPRHGLPGGSSAAAASDVGGHIAALGFAPAGGDDQPTAQPAAPAEFQSAAGEEVPTPIPVEPVEESVDGEQVNWIEVAIALAANEGNLQVVDGEVDITAAMQNLSQVLSERAASIGFGEAKKEIIGENSTVDLPIGGESDEPVGFGESMAASSSSGSGSGYPCGASSGNNAAPMAFDDVFYFTQPIGSTVNSAPGVLSNDQDPNGTPLTAHLYANAAYGTVVLNANGGFTYTPNGQPSVGDGFFYRAFDGELYSCPAFVSLPLSHVDVDTDSDNTGAVENTPYEDNIEMSQPGKVIAYNKDDDNGNFVADYQDSTAAVGGDWDLNRSNYYVKWNYASLQGFTFQWVTTGPIKIWQDVVKTPMPTTFAWGDPLSLSGFEFWVEGTGTGAATVELKMLRPGGALHQSDKVRFTVVDVDLDIGDGQQSNFADEDDEDHEGAFTVANLNDTDGDGITDSTDSNVRMYFYQTSAPVNPGATTVMLPSAANFHVGESIVIVDDYEGPNETFTITAINGSTITLSAPVVNFYGAGSVVAHHGRDEVDLMPLRISKPTTLAPGVNTMSITIPATVKLWQNSWKGTPVPTNSSGVYIIDVTTMPTSVTYWAEVLAPSTSLQDLILTLNYAGVTDSVKATGVWAEFAGAISVTKSAANILANSDWTDVGVKAKDCLVNWGGTGMRQIAGTVGGVNKGAKNAILMRFKVLPAGNPDDPYSGIQSMPNFVRFDVARSRDSGVSGWANGVEVTREREYWPLQWEDPNDDPNEDCEDFQAHHATARLYSYDAPGLQTSLVPSGGTLYVMHSNFLEWMRVSFGSVSPEGPGVQGSRVSDRFAWHVDHRLVPDTTGAKFSRSTGANPSGTNDPQVLSINGIGPGHVPFPEPPYT